MPRQICAYEVHIAGKMAILLMSEGAFKSLPHRISYSITNIYALLFRKVRYCQDLRFRQLFSGDQRVGGGEALHLSGTDREELTGF